jgi:hypothetical protein
MRIGLRQLAFTLTPPALSVALLVGIVSERSTHLKPQDVEPYHARAKAAVDAVPYIIGYWTGSDDEIPVAAQKLLRPNAILSRLYSDNSPGSAANSGAAADNRADHHLASLLIVQCRDSRDMIGHYPPICYRAHGKTVDEKSCGPRDWSVNGMLIPGYEYQFTEVFAGQTLRTIVYNFLIVPGRGIVRDMKGVERAAEDYQQRYYGAAQFQVVFHAQASAEPSREQRDAIFATLMAPNLKLIETLTAGGLK